MGIHVNQGNSVYVTDTLKIQNISGHQTPSYISGNASLNIVGGALVMRPSSGTSSEIFVGYGSVGTLNLQDGILQDGEGSYAGNGSLCVGNGENGVGVLNVSGNSSITERNHFILGGYNATSQGTATITGGTITTETGGVYVGHVGKGTLYMSGGTITSGATMYVGNEGTSSGTMYLSGGRLTRRMVCVLHRVPVPRVN